MQIISKNLAETEACAKEFISKLKPLTNRATVVALSGNLGSGKTTFTQAVGKILGITVPIQSPTFLILKSYPLPPGGFGRAGKLQVTSYKFLHHVDAYRLEKGEDLLKLGWRDLLANPKNLIFIEWPENVADVIPKDAIKISFEFIDDKTRKISIL